MPEILLFDLQRASFVDGPGIRTVVFLKGCNMRCKWCHNPESWSQRGEVGYFRTRCIGCGLCVRTCPAGAIGVDFRTDAQKCTACGACEAVCPASARKLYGKRMDTEELFKRLKADAPFYKASGGGVTFSGGECLMQMDALVDLLVRLRDAGISAAVDTAGNVPFERIEKVLPLTDWFLYDIKCITSALHQALTGTDNALILENYKRLYELAPNKLIVRTPVVPGLNDAEEEMEKIAEFLAKYPPAREDLLPYHRLGESKAEAIGNVPFTCTPPSEENMEALRTRFRSKGVPV